MMSVRPYTPSYPKDNDLSCPICWGSENGSWVIMRCQHIFHRSCIKPWILKKKTCPYFCPHDEQEIFYPTIQFGMALIIIQTIGTVYAIKPQYQRFSFITLPTFLKTIVPTACVSLGDWYKGRVGRIVGAAAGYFLTELHERAFFLAAKVSDDDAEVARIVSHTIMAMTLGYQAWLYYRTS